MNDFNPIDRVSIDELTPELQALISKVQRNENIITDHTENADIHITNEERVKWNSKADIDSPIFTGDPQAPTTEAGVYNNSIATTGFVKTEFDLYIPKLADKATKLETPVTINVGGLAVGSAQDFDGSKSIIIPIKQVQTDALFGNISRDNLTGDYDINITGNAATSTDSEGMGGKLASEYALLNSPVFIGSPKVPTAVDGDVSKQIANTEFVMQAVSTAPATKLETGRYFSVDGIVTSEPALFDGTKDVSIVVTDIDGANIKNVNASTVNGFVVEANVPKDAVFTDTVYEHPISNISVNEDTIYVGFKADAFGHIINTYEASQMEFNIQGNAKTADSLRRRVNIAYTGAITGSVSTRFAKVTEPVPVRIPIPELDEEGKEVVDENGNPVYKTDEEGNILYETDENGDYIYKTDEEGNIVYEVDENGNIVYRDAETDVTVNITAVDPSYIVQNENYRLLSDAQIAALSDKYTKFETDALIESVISAIDWKETVATFDDLATTYPDAEEGWTCSVNDTNAIFRFNGIEWVNIGSSVDIAVVSETNNGIMSSAMYKKFIGIEDNANNYVHPATHSASIITGLSTVATSGNYNDLLNTPTALPADGGNSATVNGFTVETNVPADAKFTDTVYVHPETHDASIIVQNENNRFVTDNQIEEWDAKATTDLVTEDDNGLMSSDMYKKLNSIESNANNYVHPESGVTAGTYTSVTVDKNGHITSGSNPETAGDFGIKSVPSNILVYDDPNIVKTYDRFMGSFAPYNGITINSPLITNYFANPSELKSLISVDMHLFIPSKANIYFTINININKSEITSITAFAYNGYISDSIKVNCTHEDNRFVIRIKSSDGTDGDYNGFVACKSITVMSYNKTSSLGYIAKDEWTVVDGCSEISNTIITEQANPVPMYVTMAEQCAGNAASSTTIVNNGWIIDTNDSGDIIFSNNGVVKVTVTTAGNVIASNITEQ